MKKTSLFKTLSVYLSRRMTVLFLLGFSCGVPFYLTGQTLAYWLKEEGVTYTSIGLLGLALLPSTVKFLWSPLLDRMPLPFLTRWLGRRRSWLLLSQLSAIGAILALSRTHPGEDLGLTAFLVFLISFSSSTQNIGMLAYEVESLNRSQYGPGEAMGVFGFRIGMIVSGAGALYLSTLFSWQTTYLLMTLGVGVGVLTTLAMSEPPTIYSRERKLREQKALDYLRRHHQLGPRWVQIFSWIYGSVVCPFLDLMRKKEWLAGLLLIFFYKLGDNLMGNMTIIFYNELGFSNTEIANASKIFGMGCSILGGMVGGAAILRLGVMRSLFFFAFLHGLANCLYLAMYKAGYDPTLMYVSIGLEHITAGMRLASLYTYEMLLCNPAYAATQMAIFTSMESLSRAVGTSVAGPLLDTVGWEPFLYGVILGSLPGLVIVGWIARIQKNFPLESSLRGFSPPNPRPLL